MEVKNWEDSLASPAKRFITTQSPTRHVSDQSSCLLPSARQQRQPQRPAATPSPQGQERRSASLLGICFAPVRRVFWATFSLQTPSSVAPIRGAVKDRKCALVQFSATKSWCTRWREGERETRPRLEGVWDVIKAGGYERQSKAWWTAAGAGGHMKSQLNTWTE